MTATLTGKSLALRALEVVYITRFMDDKCFKLSRQNKGGTFQLSVAGHELVGALCALSLTPGKDWGLPYYRDRAFAVGLGCTPVELFGAFLARAVSHQSGGRMMPDHFSHKELRIPCQSSCVGSQFLHAVGVAKSVQLAGKDDVVYVSAGDGATSQGDFHEALNFAAIHNLGVIFVIQDNGWAISVPLSEQTAGASIVKTVSGYEGLAVTEVDGCDFEQMSKAASTAVMKARMGEGPSVIVAKVPRLGPHSNSDDPTKYREKPCLEKERAKDPIPRLEKWVLDMGLATIEEIEELKKRLFADVEKAAADAEQIPFPDPATVLDNVFLPAPDIVHTEEPKTKAGEGIVLVDALHNALDEEMELDRHVVVFGEDVAHGKGGVFGVTRGLTAKHGADRCFNSPLAESTVIGVAIGMSFAYGMKPVVEIQFADYVWPGIDQIFSELSSICYRSNAEWNCPVVVRMPYGGYIQGGPYHSQSIEAYLAHCPGLKVVIPSNAADAKRLLKSAIRDPNPVLFLEHKALYRQRVFCARPETETEELLPFGKAKVVRQGRDVTLVGWGMMMVMAVEVAEKLSQEGIEVEIIDLRTLVPLDMETVITSVKKTGKLLIAHEAPKSGGFGAEIAARIGESAFTYLDAPIARIGGKECAVPYCKLLEDLVLPQRHDIEKALRELALY